MKQFQMINGPEVPKSIQPMTELHDNLVIGYEKGREIKLPLLIQSIEKRVIKQVDELCTLESQIQSSGLKVMKCIDILQQIVKHDDTTRKMTDYIIDSLKALHGDK